MNFVAIICCLLTAPSACLVDIVFAKHKLTIGLDPDFSFYLENKIAQLELDGKPALLPCGAEIRDYLFGLVSEEKELTQGDTEAQFRAVKLSLCEVLKEVRNDNVSELKDLCDKQEYEDFFTIVFRDLSHKSTKSLNQILQSRHLGRKFFEILSSAYKESVGFSRWNRLQTTIRPFDDIFGPQLRAKYPIRYTSPHFGSIDSLEESDTGLGYIYQYSINFRFASPEFGAFCLGRSNTSDFNAVFPALTSTNCMGVECECMTVLARDLFTAAASASRHSGGFGLRPSIELLSRDYNPDFTYYDLNVLQKDFYDVTKEHRRTIQPFTRSYTQFYFTDPNTAHVSIESPHPIKEYSICYANWQELIVGYCRIPSASASSATLKAHAVKRRNRKKRRMLRKKKGHR